MEQGGAMAKPNVLKVSCWELGRSMKGLLTDTQNRVVIQRDVLPIIFVPGIMGSRLKTGDGVVWDPDDPKFMLRKFGFFWATSAHKRKSLLIGSAFSEGYAVVDNDNDKHNECFFSQQDNGRAKRRWGGVSWSSYGTFLEKLQTRTWDSTINLFFEFPVHCFGYNWSASNRFSGKQLTSYIDDVIQSYRDKKRRCDKVILISHSMGGLVARAACKLSEAEARVLGVIHGVQPTNGSPAGYWRMKGGFERPHSIPDFEPIQWFRNPEKIPGYGRRRAHQGQRLVRQPRRLP